MNIFLIFILSSVGLIITPGPDFIFVLTQGIFGGRVRGVLSACGISCGICVHAIAASLGLGILVSSIPGLLILIKILGGLYLIFLGYNIAISKNNIEIQKEKEINKGGCFFQGFLTNILNPKIIIFFIAFLPQFAIVDNGHYRLQLFSFGLIYALITLLYYSIVGFSSGHIGVKFMNNAKTIKLISFASGIVIILLGLFLLLSLVGNFSI